MDNVDGFSLGLEINYSESFEMFIKLSSCFLRRKKVVPNYIFRKHTPKQQAASK